MSKVVFVLFLLLGLILLYLTLVIECEMGCGCGIVNFINRLIGLPEIVPTCTVCPEAFPLPSRHLAAAAFSFPCQ